VKGVIRPNPRKHPPLLDSEYVTSRNQRAPRLRFGRSTSEWNWHIHDLAHDTLGNAVGAKQDWDNEIIEEREVLRLNPNNDLTHFNLGLALVGIRGKSGITPRDGYPALEGVRQYPGNVVTNAACL